jgi:Obg family GTPase CgtA
MVFSIRRTLLRQARTPIRACAPSLRAFAASALRPRQHHREFDENGPYARQHRLEKEHEEALAEEDFDEFEEYESELHEAPEEPPVYETLEQLSNSGRVDPPLLPVRPIHYKLPYNVDSYRQRQRVWEGNDAADPSSSTALFTDIKIIRLGSGKGGDGKVSFFRDSGRSRGPPDGGDGGDGGSVYIQAVSDETSLHKLRYHYRAEDGRPGAMASLNGRAGKDTLLQVPVGTIIKWIPDPKQSFAEWKAKKLERIAEGQSANLRELNVRVDVVTDEFDRDMPLGIKLARNSYADGEGWIFRDKNETYHTERDYFIELRDRVRGHDRGVRRQEENEDYFPIEGVDLSQPGPPLLLLRGGRGGLGNTHFHTQLIRNPRFSKRGRAGIEAYFLLELKLLADLGLVGLPNAGKSTLLRAVSRARPRVGHWEFTTLRPTVGTISLGLARPSFTVADIPGIIRGARAENKGMGLDFLRHVERSGGLVFVISLEQKDAAGAAAAVDAEIDVNAELPSTAGTGSVVGDLELLIDELGPERMSDKRVLVVGTKADLPGAEANFRLLKAYCDERGWACIPCCAQRKENVESVIELMGRTAGKA